eukprot:CAMPEP_0114360302 /NCGR_PEP_ID=MMETSP0101-20121206/23743_1 /TAXON_ID=38822 ORGANISM="Pteridomonas danica, Strain PT" /NCGR_SAMPLE_ID=MMETSP0101 /ASSEMBLY_ACC=CAM_ASM_000211 /LENGTH=413 /DNA_ID=CAMNT_0001504433 /DNA_START=68 /DNA_END=1306 /DNA_ORIENTATION=+
MKEATLILEQQQKAEEEEKRKRSEPMWEALQGKGTALHKARGLHGLDRETTKRWDFMHGATKEMLGNVIRENGYQMPEHKIQTWNPEAMRAYAKMQGINFVPNGYIVRTIGAVVKLQSAFRTFILRKMIDKLKVAKEKERIEEQKLKVQKAVKNSKNLKAFGIKPQLNTKSVPPRSSTTRSIKSTVNTKIMIHKFVDHIQDSDKETSKPQVDTSVESSTTPTMTNDVVDTMGSNASIKVAEIEKIKTNRIEQNDVEVDEVEKHTHYEIANEKSIKSRPNSAPNSRASDNGRSVLKPGYCVMHTKSNVNAHNKDDKEIRAKENAFRNAVLGRPSSASSTIGKRNHHQNNQPSSKFLSSRYPTLNDRKARSSNPNVGHKSDKRHDHHHSTHHGHHEDRDHDDQEDGDNIQSNPTW